MFSKKLFTQQRQTAGLFRQPQRFYQTFTKNYMTGFDRTLLDKLSFLKVNGHWFAMLGLFNALAYGASLLMPKDWYTYHFGYRGHPTGIFKSIKSQVGSNTLANAIWTSPVLILLGGFMHNKVGPLAMTKFFFMSMFSTFIFLSAFNPDTGMNFRPLQKIFPKWDSYADDGSYFMGADQMAQALCYFALMYHRYWYLAFAFIASDILYYGPSTLGGPIAGAVGALMFS
jgi:hypothetical protein